MFQISSELLKYANYFYQRTIKFNELMIPQHLRDYRIRKSFSGDKKMRMKEEEEIL